MRLRLPVFLVALVAFFALGVGAAAQIAGDQVCASATASTPDHVIGVDVAPVSTLMGASSTSDQCVSIPTVTVVETVSGPTTTVTQTETVTSVVTSTVQVPARHVLWGSSTPPNPAHGTSSREEEARWLEGKIGRKLDITRHYVRAPNDWTGDGAGASVNSGHNVVVTFTSGGDSWNQVANGSLDSYVRTQVNALEARGGLWNNAYIAFENEPEAESPGKGSPADYVRAYDHLIQVGNAAGMPAHWTTAFMEYSWQSGSGRNPEAWVPKGIGTLGVHVYFTRVGTCGAGIRSFSSGVDDPYATATAHNLRMGIWEAGYSTAVGTNPEAKADFFRSIPTELVKFPRIDAITYWNQGSGKCADANSYYIDSSAAALQGFTDAGHEAGITPDP